MPSRHDAIQEALAPLYERFGDPVTVTLLGEDDAHWMALRCDGFRLAWPYARDKGEEFAADCARALDNCRLLRCEPGDHLAVSMDLPPVKGLAELCDQVFARVFHQGKDGPLRVEVEGA